MNDPIQFAKQVADLVRDQVARSTEPLLERIKQLEERPVPKDGEPGRDGTSVTLEEVLAALPEPVHGKDGEPGRDGSSVTVEDVLPILLAAIPEPVHGKDGEPGRDGKDGASVTLPEVLAAFEPDVKAYLASVPLPADGKPGRDGASVTLDEVKAFLESHMGLWALDFERRAQDLYQRTLDRMPPPAPGKDGRDATSLEDIDLVLGDDGRTVTLRFMGGDQIREKSIRLATVLDRGVFKEGEVYEPGDAVSWGGSLWIAQTQTKARPEGADWRLAVKKGRDGKDLRPDDAKSTEVYKLRGNRA